jgi:hypothetical protein
MRKFRAQTTYNIDAVEEAIMQEIYHWGPIVSGFYVKSDFMYGYDGKTIYTHPNKSGDDLGGHAISIVGWGEEMQDGELVKFWWIRNSWGADWGYNGFFKFKRGMKDCGMEDNAMAFIPEFIGLPVIDTSIIPIQTQAEIDAQNFSEHILDIKSGYYLSALQKVKDCKLYGDVYEYISPSFQLPDYNKFIAGQVSNFQTGATSIPKMVQSDCRNINKISDAPTVNVPVVKQKSSILSWILTLLILIIIGVICYAIYRYNKS